MARSPDRDKGRRRLRRASPLRLLRAREGVSYTIALITNERLKQMAEDLLETATQEHERTGKKARLFGEDPYGAASWEKERRVVYKAEAMEQGINRRFVVSTKDEEPKELYEFYARRGEAENWIKDLKLALKADRLSCQSVHRQPVSTSHLCHAERHAR